MSLFVSRARGIAANRGSLLLFTTVCCLLSAILATGQVLGAASSNSGPDSGTAFVQSSSPLSYWTNRGRFTLGFQLGFGLEQSPPRDYSHAKMLIAEPQWGTILWDSPRSRLPIKRWEWINEGIFGNAVHPGGRMTGYSILWRFSGKAHGDTVPFFDMGGGVMNTTLPDYIPELTGRTQFMPQAGFGIEHFFAPERAWVIEYRYIHVSNASLENPNPGFDGSMISIGIRWLRRPPRPPGWQSARQHNNLFKFFFGKE